MLSLKRLLLITSHPPRMPPAAVRSALLCTEIARRALNTSSPLQLRFCPRCLGTTLFLPQVQFNPAAGHKYLWGSQLVFKLPATVMEGESPEKSHFQSQPQVGTDKANPQVFGLNSSFQVQCMAFESCLCNTPCYYLHTLALHF